jgi:hypothetical protein
MGFYQHFTAKLRLYLEKLSYSNKKGAYFYQVNAFAHILINKYVNLVLNE